MISKLVKSKYVSIDFHFMMGIHNITNIMIMFLFKSSFCIRYATALFKSFQLRPNFQLGHT